VRRHVFPLKSVENRRRGVGSNAKSTAVRRAVLLCTIQIPLVVQKECEMLRVRTPRLTLYVDRSRQQWVVLDQSGRFWGLPNVENPWAQRQPIYPTEDTELEPIPGHYKYMLGLPSGVEERDA
jgi:hypothetical protein